MKICVIGGGLCGLTAACLLSREHELELFEQEDRLGGCLATYSIDGYEIEKFYHHFFAGDECFISLATSLGLSDRLEWLKGTTGYYAEGRVYPLNTPIEILRYPHLTLVEKARLASLALRARGMDAEKLDSITAKDFILRECGEGVYRSFFEPLLRSKFGARSGEISAAWLVSRVAIRSNRGVSGERLGYIRGGFGRFVEALARCAGSRGCRLHLNAPVTSVRRVNNGWEVNGRRFERVISTVAPQVLNRISELSIPEIPYQGAATLLLGLSRGVTEGVYWLNMRDPAPYGAVIEHTNFVPLERYGEHIVYLASYFDGMLEEGREREMLADFSRRFSLKEAEIHWKRMAVERYAGPVFVAGYRNSLLPYEERGLLLAGMFSRSNYPERSMEGSIRAAMEVAARVKGEDDGS